MSDTISQALSSAKEAGAKAEKDFPTSSAPASDAKSHEYSKAPYSMVGALKKKLSAPMEEYHKAVKDVEAPGTKEGIDWANAQK